MVGAQPEVPGGITSLKPDVTFTPTQKKLPEPIDMSVEERTGGMLKEGKEGEYISTMDQESGAANVDPSIMSLGDTDDFKYEMAVFRQNRQKKLEPIYKKYGAVSKEEKDFVDDFIGLDSEDRVELLKSDPKYKTSTTKLFIEDTVKNQPGIKQEELMEVVYGSTGEKILKERGLNDFIQYAKKEIEELGGVLNEDLLMRGLKDGFNDTEGFANGGRIGFKEGVGRKGILSALTDKLNEIAPGSTGIGKTTKAMSEAAKRKRAEEEMFKNFEERNPIKGEEPKLEPNTKIIEREKIDVDIGTIEDFYDDFVQAGGDPSVKVKDLQQAYNLKKAYPFNTPYIDKKGKLIGQEATQQMYPESKKFYIEDQNVLSQRITDAREGRAPRTAEGERTGVDVPPMPEGFKLSREKLLQNYPEIDEAFADQIMAMDKGMQGQMLTMLKNRRQDPELYDELLEKYGDTDKFQGEYDKALRRRKNASGGLNYLMGM